MEMFTEKMLNAIESGFLKSLAKGEIFKSDYQTKIDVNPAVSEAFKLIDFKRLHDKIKFKLEEVLAEKIVNKVVTELGNDIKKMMSNETIRDDFRFMLRTNVQKVLDKVRADDNET